MKKLLSLAIAFAWSCALFAQQDIVQFKTSRPYCLMSFMETAHKGRATSATFRKYIEENIPSSDTFFWKKVTQFSHIQLDYQFNRDDYPSNRHSARSTYDLFCIAAVQATDIKDFKNRTVGILPNDDHRAYFDILAAIEPYYDKIIWSKYAEKTEKQVDSLRQYQQQANEGFELLRTFYGSSWGKDMPFTVAIYPIPGQRGNTTATPHANSLCVGMLTDETDYVGRMGVVMHEICHVLYDEQPLALQLELETYFDKNKSQYSTFAHNFIDEGLATAGGNGWAYHFFSGRLDPSEWYSNVYIDGFGHALHPLMTQYIAAHKTIDQAFIDSAIQLFTEAFPKAIYDYRGLFSKMNIFSDAENEAERQSIWINVGKRFMMSSTNLSTPILDAASLESLQGSNLTQLIIIDKNTKINILKMQELFPDMAKWLHYREDEAYYCSFLDVSKRPIVIIKADNETQFQAVIEQLYEDQYIDTANPYHAVK